CFQGDDGIRDSSVTGVQTCALPISRNGIDAGVAWRRRRFHSGKGLCLERCLDVDRDDRLGADEPAAEVRPLLEARGETADQVLGDRKSVVSGKKRGGGGDGRSTERA